MENKTEEHECSGICDIHSHVLYGIDDGSLSLEMSLDLVREEIAQGVSHLFCASHGWGTMEDYPARFAALQARVTELALPITLHTGCEIACLREDLPRVIEGILSGRLPTMNGTEFVMIEFRSWAPFDEFTQIIDEIYRSTGKRVIMAHAERCDAIREDPEVAARLCDRGMLVQMNTSSLMWEKEEITRNAARALAARRIPSFLGSDAHRTDYRAPEVESGMAYLRDICDPDYLEALCFGNARKYLHITQ